MSANVQPVDLGDGESVLQCLDCGAHAALGEQVVHHSTCCPDTTDYEEDVNPFDHVFDCPWPASSCDCGVFAQQG